MFSEHERDDLSWTANDGVDDNEASISARLPDICVPDEPGSRIFNLSRISFSTKRSGQQTGIVN